VVRTGFEAVLQKKRDYPMPAYLKFETDTIEKMEAFQFDDPWDERRYFDAGDDQLNGVGDGYAPNIPAFVDRVREAYAGFSHLRGRLRGPRDAVAHHRL
jgi:hypothetical protein